MPYHRAAAGQNARFRRSAGQAPAKSKRATWRIIPARRIGERSSWISYCKRRYAQTLQSQDISRLVPKHACLTTFARWTEACGHAGRLLVAQLLAGGG